MSRKDYIKIADILKTYMDGYEGTPEFQWLIRALMKDFSNMLGEDNPRFDEKRFEDYIEK